MTFCFDSNEIETIEGVLAKNQWVVLVGISITPTRTPTIVLGPNVNPIVRERMTITIELDVFLNIKERKKNVASGENSESGAVGHGACEGKKALYHCNYCNKDISGKMWIKCAMCPDFDLCDTSQKQPSLQGYGQLLLISQVPGGDNAFVISHSNGNLYVYEKGDSSFPVVKDQSQFFVAHARYNKIDQFGSYFCKTRAIKPIPLTSLDSVKNLACWQYEMVLVDNFLREGGFGGNRLLSFFFEEDVDGSNRNQFRLHAIPVMANLPVEVITEILSRLSVKLVLGGAPSSTPPTSSYSISANPTPPSFSVTAPTSTPLTFNPSRNPSKSLILSCYNNNTKVLGSCNNLICISNVADDIALWNPHLRKHQILLADRFNYPDSSLACLMPSATRGPWASWRWLCWEARVQLIVFLSQWMELTWQLLDEMVICERLVTQKNNLSVAILCCTWRLWKPTLCPHCDTIQKQRSMMIWQSDSDDSERVPVTRRHGGSQKNLRVVDNGGRFNGNGTGFDVTDVPNFAILLV
ncbi:hypothetical protein V8G54_034063 [Vigna mungo]|uniref:ZZ-type domain-containing protein n=1 Tax=Vigna mungo TaxID=3915 RepID=A0AAQ3RKC1_VIGMU